MRWIITLLIVVALGTTLWFVYPMLDLSGEASPYDHYPETTWLVIESAHADSLFAEVNDSGSFYHAIPSVALLANELAGFQDLFSSSSAPLTILASGEMIRPEWTFIVHDKLKETHETERGTWTTSKHLTVFSAQPIKQPMSADQVQALKRSRQGLSENSETHLLFAPSALNSWLALELQDEMAQLIANEYQGTHWLAFDASDEGPWYQMNGIASISGDSKEEQTTGNDLLRYIPSSATLAMLGATKQHAYALINTTYDILSAPTDNNIIVLFNRVKDTTLSMQQTGDYEGIALYTTAMDDTAGLAYVPSWAAECASITLGDVRVFAQNNEQMERFISDHLSDDRLLQSAAFEGLETRISDASFTIIVRPEAVKHPSPFFKSDQMEGNRVNTLIFQSYSELSGQKFFALNAIHHRDIPEVLPTLWTLELEAPAVHGPWRFTNHYTKAREVLVQDSSNQLYLINADGRILWKRQLDHPVVGDVQEIDAFASGKLQLLFATEKYLHLVDRNGNNVEGFPVKLDQQASVQPTAVRYSAKSDYRILMGDGITLRNIDPTGKAVEGWKNPKLPAPLTLPVTWYFKSGKDYLVAVCEDSSMKAFERTGQTRIKRIQLPASDLGMYLREGSSLAECGVVMADNAGNLFHISLNGKRKEQNLLPLGDEVGFAYNPDHRVHYLSIKGDHLIGLNEDLDVELDYLLPESIAPRIQLVWPQKGWLALQSEHGQYIYVMNSDGRMFDKMPLNGTGHCLITDLDGNGSRELIVGSAENTLVAYKLSD